MKYFSHMLNVHEFSEVKQTKIHIDKWLEPENDCFDIEIAIDSLKTL